MPDQAEKFAAGLGVGFENTLEIGGGHDATLLHATKLFATVMGFHHQRQPERRMLAVQCVRKHRAPNAPESEPVRHSSPLPYQSCSARVFSPWDEEYRRTNIFPRRA